MSKRTPRTKRNPAIRLRAYWLVLLVLLAGVGAGAYYAATWPGFDCKSIRVEGNHVVPSSEVAARAQISPHANIWLQNMGAAANRIEAIPYVDRVWIHRRLPAGVTIEVTERKPAAIVQTPLRRVIVDATLRVLEDAPAQSDLPVLLANVPLPQAGGTIKAQRVQRLHNDLQVLTQAHVIVTRVEFDRFEDLTAVLRGGVRLLLGDDQDLAQKSAMVAPILSQTAAQGRRVAAVDLRAPKAPVVQYR